jgi:uncharacterized protein DUF1360
VLSTRIVLASLATWRLAHLVAEEDGPANVIARARARAGTSRLGELMDCFYCLSLWAAAPFALVTAPRRRDVPLTWLALSGAACLLERTTPTPEKGAWNVLWEAPARGGGSDAAEAGEPANAAATAETVRRQPHDHDPTCGKEDELNDAAKA